jgi:hypothetical protein
LDFCFFVGEETFLKESFLPPHPYLQRTAQGKYIKIHSAFDHDVRTNQSVKVLVKLFQKLVGS